MKFSQLPIGQSFRYQGQVYQKTSPLMASAEDAKEPRLIARSALVEPLEAEAGSASATLPPDKIPREQLDQAMNELAQALNQILQHSGLKDDALNQTLGHIQQAMLRTRQQLKL